MLGFPTTIRCRPRSINLILTLVAFCAAGGESRPVLLGHSFGHEFEPYDALSENFRSERARQSTEALDFFDLAPQSARFDNSSQEGPFATGTTPCAPASKPSFATAEDDVAPPLPSAQASYFLWHVELKQQVTDRGTIEEDSKTTLRLEATPQHFFLSLVRVDIPFIEGTNGIRIGPHLGDIKNKLVSRSIPLGGMVLAAVFETTFPTAQPETLGSGKYQLGPGAELRIPLSGAKPAGVPPAWSTSLKPWIEQVFSVAGDESRKDINYTKLELELKAEWRKKLILKLTPKFVFDWEQGGDAGAVLELEGGWNFGRRWGTSLTLGHELWNTDAPATYGKKIELSVRFNF